MYFLRFMSRKKSSPETLKLSNFSLEIEYVVQNLNQNYVSKNSYQTTIRDITISKILCFFSQTKIFFKNNKNSKIIREKFYTWDGDRWFHDIICMNRGTPGVPSLGWTLFPVGSTIQFPVPPKLLPWIELTEFVEDEGPKSLLVVIMTCWVWM